MDALYTALSGLMAQTDALDQVSGNLANQMSPGFLAQTGQVVDGIDQTVSRVGGTGSATLGTVPSGVVYTNSVLTSPSPIQATGVNTDLAISGNGFFAVQSPAGIQYTRDGALTVEPGGHIATASGALLLGTSGAPIVVNPSQSFQVAGDGTITQNGAAVGKIALFQVPSGSLLATANDAYRAAQPTVVAGAGVSVVQGSLNGANVSLTGATQSMLQAQSSYQSLTTLVNAESKRLGEAVGLGLLA